MKSIITSIQYDDRTTHHKHVCPERDVGAFCEHMAELSPESGTITNVAVETIQDELELSRLYMLNNGKCIKLDIFIGGTGTYRGRDVNMQTGLPRGAYMFWFMDGTHRELTEINDNPLDIIMDGV